jgi:hypothetical protein
MQKLIVLLALLAATAGLTAQTPQQAGAPPDGAQAPKPDPKAPASIAGKWTMTVDTDQGPMANQLDIKLDGKKVTGTLESQMGSAPIVGEFADGKLTFSMSFDGPNGSMDIAFTGTLQEDGSLSGMLTGGQGAFQLSWKAQRVKDK